MAHLITQTEADYFFQMEKIPESKEPFSFPFSGTKIVLPFTSVDKREFFLFDIHRSSIKLSKATYQNRARKTFIIRRLDLDGPPHQNPESENVPLPFLAPYNGKDIECPHMHIYVEGFSSRWAVPAQLFWDIDGKDIYESLFDFFVYCSVKKLPAIKKGLLL